MTEQPTAPDRPGDEEGAHASVGKDVAEPGGGRTDREAAVREAMGQGGDGG